jgi:hypothetical protein
MEDVALHHDCQSDVMSGKHEVVNLIVAGINGPAFACHEPNFDAPRGVGLAGRLALAGGWREGACRTATTPTLALAGSGAGYPLQDSARRYTVWLRT